MRLVFSNRGYIEKFLMLFLFLVVINISYAAVYEDDLIDNYRGLYAPYLELHDTGDIMFLTKGEHALICPLINWRNICGTLDNFHISYNLTSDGKTDINNMTRYSDTEFIKSIGLNSQDIKNNDLWCYEGNIDQNSELVIFAYCGDYGTPEIVDYKKIHLYAGNISIKQSYLLKEYNNLDYGFYPGENMSFAIYAEIGGESIGINDINMRHKYYSLLNPSDISIFPYNPRRVDSNESVWIEKMQIDNDTAIGLISFGLTYEGDLGGRYLLYRSKPFKSEIKIFNEEDHNEYNYSDMVSTKDHIIIDVSGLNTIYYGNYTSVKAYIDTPEGKHNLNISIDNYITNYTIDSGEGLYNISVDILHNSGYREILNRTIVVKDDYISIIGLLDEYVPGDYAVVSLKAYRSDDTPLLSIINFTIVDVSGRELLTLTDKDATINKYTHTFAFSFPKNANYGNYTFIAMAKNGSRLIISKKYVELKSMEDYVNISVSPNSWILEPINSLTAQKKTFILTNHGGRKIMSKDINFSATPNIEDYLSFDTSLLQNLSYNESGTFSIVFTPKDDISEGSYNGTIIIDAYGKKTEILVEVNVSLRYNLYVPSPLEYNIDGDKKNEINVSVSNKGDKLIKNLKISNLQKSDEVKFYRSYKLPKNIRHNSDANITFYLDRFDNEGKYNISFFIENEDYSREVIIYINAYTGLQDKIIVLNRTILTLKKQLMSSNISNSDKSSLESKIIDLEDSLQNINNLISEKKFDSAKDEISKIDAEVKQISKDINDLSSKSETSKTLKSEDYEDSDDSEGGSHIGIISFFVFLVVLGVIIYSSIVPEDYDK